MKKFNCYPFMTHNCYPFMTYKGIKTPQFEDLHYSVENNFIENLADEIYHVLIKDNLYKGKQIDAHGPKTETIRWRRMLFDDENYYNVFIGYDDTDLPLSFRLVDSSYNLPNITPEKLALDFVNYLNGLLKLRGIQNITIDPDSTVIQPGFDNSDFITKAQIAVKVSLPENKTESTKDTSADSIPDNQDKDADK